MSEHTELPWRAVRDTGIRNDGGYIVFSKAKPFHYPGQDERYEREIQEWHGNLEFIVQACNSYEDLLAECKNAVKQMEDEPVQAGGEWEQGLFCGLEDMGITDRYAACRHGYDKALERVQEWIIDEIESAIEKAKPKE